jgi:hypothetical protein
MPSITSWIRLEPSALGADEKIGLQARVHDPLWLLGRQWQMGEFQGSDGGSPIVARLRAESALIARYQLGPFKGGGQGRPYDGKIQPLEALVEREAIRQPERLLLSADAGLHFLRLLKRQPLSKAYREPYLQKYPIRPLTPEQRSQMDAASIRAFDMLAGRVPNGDLLYADLRRDVNTLPAEPVIEAIDVPLVKAAGGEWLAWYERMFSEPTAGESAWLDERLEYSFAVSARTSAGEQTLIAREYIDGQLDWYAFDKGSGVSLGAATDAAPKAITRTTIPAVVTFRGMPAPRWWEFEDAQVDFGGVDAGPEDLARMLLIEFAVNYGNDWFVIPIEVETGSLCTIRSLIITDTFGERYVIPDGAASKSPWRMFQLAADQPASDRTAPTSSLFVPPVVLKNVQGPPIEDVVFFRDEMANMAWAVERVVQGPDGRAMNRHDEYVQRISEPPAGNAPAGTLKYELSTSVPDHWIPLVPVQVNGSRAVRLRRAAMLDSQGVPQFGRAKGRVLNPRPGQRLDLYEEEVPREGIRVIRTYQYTRWLDGTTHLWIGRRKDIGRGEGSSELRFDTLT